jgi:hypothetical protein
MATSLNSYCSGYAKYFGVPYACAILWTSNILPQMDTMKRFCKNILKNYGFVHYSSLMLCLSSFNTGHPPFSPSRYLGKIAVNMYS